MIEKERNANRIPYLAVSNMLWHRVYRENEIIAECSTAEIAEQIASALNAVYKGGEG